MIKVGTSGFQFPDWKGVVYPESIKAPDMLPYLKREWGFQAMEVNFTYYSMPGTRTMKSLTERTTPDMDFSVKAHQTMTHKVPEAAAEREDVFSRPPRACESTTYVIAAVASSSEASGSSTKKVLPFPTSLSAQMRPPWRSTISLLM